MKNRIAIDLGGTKIEVILTEDSPLNVIEKIRVPTAQENGYEFILNQIAEVVKAFQKKCDHPPLIGMGIPGNLSHSTGLVKNSNTQCLIGKPLKQDLEALVGQQVFVDNDANCFTLAEALYGAGQGKSLVMGVIMGTGFGGGLVKDGQVWHGHQGIAGEWGHSTINFNGPLCWCGRKGCVESYLSGPALEAHYRQLGGRSLPLAVIYEKYLAAEPIAVEVIERALFLFGEAVANLICSIDPDIVVLGGGVSNLPVLYDKGVEEVRKRLFNEDLTTQILPNQLGDSSGVYGAAMLGGIQMGQ